MMRRNRSHTHTHTHTHTHVEIVVVAGVQGFSKCTRAHLSLTFSSIANIIQLSQCITLLVCQPSTRNRNICFSLDVHAHKYCFVIFSNIIAINKCLSNPCQNVGTCVARSGMFSCRCANGFTGVFCEISKFYWCDYFIYYYYYYYYYYYNLYMYFILLRVLKNKTVFFYIILLVCFFLGNKQCITRIINTNIKTLV